MSSCALCELSNHKKSIFLKLFTVSHNLPQQPISLLGFNTFQTDFKLWSSFNEDSGRFYYRTAGQPPLLIPTSSTTTSTHKQEYDGRMQQQVQEEEEQNNSYTHIADIKRTFANDLDTYKSFWGFWIYIVGMSKKRFLFCSQVILFSWGILHTTFCPTTSKGFIYRNYLIAFEAINYESM